ncbi:hypothetical protein BDV33DRAFT_66606 [Aspergillus novoparasiticus]|uniref:Aminoglycoside phosphotransferase domain-containing protein n=1 Tax=Aspergillus novoparasiticus TaxID=986946 RepID=A0A5N6E700_9EURO|nr:hypothetical protein BDV33DRAFT_66606 [Aspergillus novoparasiticus]
MPKTRQLLHEELTYSHAKSKETNILHQLKYPSQQSQFFTLLQSKRSWIRVIVAHHLNLPSSNACQVADVGEWLHGSFNVCIPVTILEWNQKQQSGHRVLVRFPLPYRIGEDFRPGNGDEKVRCEAGTYAWIEENCPDIPIPRLYGFGMATGETFTRTENLPILTRWIQHLRQRVLLLLGRPTPSRYIRHQRRTEVPKSGWPNVGYLIIEYIEETKGKMLSSTWSLKRDDVKLRKNFFRDLSRIYLSLSRTPLPRIGSFIIDNNGFICLQNRPLSLGIQDLENERIPTDMPRDYTYSTVDSYIVDILSLHDSRLLHQPNAINDLGDYIYQTSSLTTMRAISSSFFHRDLRRGPFIFSLTDLHPSNIFVDENWNITSLVDLEWACSLPIEMIQPPHWLTSMAVDRIVSSEYNTSRLEFMSALTNEEGSRSPTCKDLFPISLKLSGIMSAAWDKGTFWYSLALSSPTGLFAIFYKELQPRFINKCPDHGSFHQIMPWYWKQDIVTILTHKLADKEAYDMQLRHEFENDTSLS